MLIQNVPTPAILLDKKIMEENSRKMEELIRGTSMVLYPHYKSHKCPELARWQMAHGAGGITCAKLGEAQDLVEAGIPVVVIANQIVQPEKLEKLALLAGKASMTVCADDPDNVLALEAACAKAGTRLNVLVEYEVGMQRCGAETHAEVLQLAQLIRRQKHLNFAGIQAYAGQLSHETEAARRKTEILRIEKDVAALKAFVEQHGIPVLHVCGGSTGTAADKPKDTVYTQLQAGSYLFMDASYERLGLVFRQARFILTTVVSVKKDRIVTDCGVKSLAMDQVTPRYAAFPDAALSFSEEHTTLFVEGAPLKGGDKLLAIPGHCCTTNNSFEKILLAESGEIIREMPVTSRGKAW